MYLNVYVPALQCESGVVGFFRRHRGRPFASSALMDPMTKSFVAATERFAQDHGVPVVQFQKGQRKDDVMKERLRRFDKPEGVVFIGKAQEKTPVFRTERRRNPETGQRYPWIVRSTAMVNHYYWYCLDRDFGPFFLKFCSYFPYNAKLCLNGHEYAKCQLRQEGIDYKALDNGFVSCADPGRLQTICDRSAENFRRKIGDRLERNTHRRRRGLDAWHRANPLERYLSNSPYLTRRQAHRGGSRRWHRFAWRRLEHPAR
jgi:hypothetical protein